MCHVKLLQDLYRTTAASTWKNLIDWQAYNDNLLSRLLRACGQSLQQTWRKCSKTLLSIKLRIDWNRSPATLQIYIPTWVVPIWRRTGKSAIMRRGSYWTCWGRFLDLRFLSVHAWSVFLPTGWQRVCTWPFYKNVHFSCRMPLAGMSTNWAL